MTSSRRFLDIEVCPLEGVADRDEYVRLRNLAFPDMPWTRERMETDDEIFPADKVKVRRLLRRDGKAVGGFVLTESYWLAEPGIYKFDCVEDGLTLDEYVALVGVVEEEARRHDGREVYGWNSDRRVVLMEALDQCGYERVQSNPQTELELATFDPAAFEEAVASLESSGLRLLDVPAFAKTDPEGWKRKLWQAEFELVSDVPVPWELVQTPFEQYEKELDSDEEHWPWIWLVLDGDRIVATTMLFRNKVDPGRFWTGLTSVGREYRRQGIATAIKAKILTAAKEAGGRVVSTDNEENNPMLQLNLRLGFQEVYRWVVSKKVL